MQPIAWISELPLGLRIVVLLLLALCAHLLVRGIRKVAETAAAPKGPPGATTAEAFARVYPKFSTVLSLVASAVTFAIYFVAIGLILRELGLSLGAYLASASVVGLAIGFGSQGLVQDVVIGLTLLFSDAFDVGDVIEVSGQIGRVENLGLRFTTLLNFQGQRVFVPNRNIALVGRYRGGCVRAYADVELPEGVAEEEVLERVDELARGMRTQYRSIVISDPEVFGIFRAEPAGWRYVRVKFRIWPGQGALIEQTFRQRVLAAMRTLDPAYADWMVSVVYRVA